VLGGVRLNKAEMVVQTSSLAQVAALQAAGHDVGWRHTGSLHLATSHHRLAHLRRTRAIALARATQCEMLGPGEVAERHAAIATEDVLGALWVPADGVCDPYKLCRTLLEQANEQGVGLVEGCSVNKVLVKEGRVQGVETSKGVIECEVFVNAAGAWARHVGTLSDPPVHVPVYPADHYSIDTWSLPGFDDLPAIRDPDNAIYVRPFSGGVMMGYFAAESIPSHVPGLTAPRGDPPRPPDWDHMGPGFAQLLRRLPGLRAAVLRRLVVTPSACTPDARMIAGMAPEIENYFVGAGLCYGGSNVALGLAELIRNSIFKAVAASPHAHPPSHAAPEQQHDPPTVGHMSAKPPVTSEDIFSPGHTSGHALPPLDAYELEVARFPPSHSNERFLRDRAAEVPGVHHQIAYPFPDMQTARGVRMSPIYQTMKKRGAVFGQVMGYERPCYFRDPSDPPDPADPPHPPTTPTFSCPPWFEATRREYMACREAAGLLDYSSFSKFDIQSQDDSVVAWLQRLCSNDVDIPVGAIIHTGMQNPGGGYENDCSLVRIASNHYLLIAPTIQQTRCLAWLRRHAPRDDSVLCSDVTSMYTAVCLMGPKAKEILSSVTDFDLSQKNFPFFSYREIDVGFVSGIRAMNLTHTGELGWVLYIPNEFALHVYTTLWTAGQPHGLRHAGYFAMRSLRIERFYAFWGQDLDSLTSPLECGRAFRVKLDKDIDFIGRGALERQRLEGVRRLYAHLALQEHDPATDAWPWGGEPILRDGEYVGVTTTTGYGYTLDRLVCLGFIRRFDDHGNMLPVDPQYVLAGSYEVDIAGIRYPATVSLRSPTLPSLSPAKGRNGAHYHATRVTE